MNFMRNGTITTGCLGDGVYANVLQPLPSPLVYRDTIENFANWNFDSEIV